MEEELNVLEVLMSAQYNFENIVKMNLQLGQHPIFIIAKSQLDNVIEQLQKDEG